MTFPVESDVDSARPSSQPAQGLAARSAVAFGWTLFAGLAKVLLTIGVQAVLARWLGPGPYGLFALALLIVGVAGYFADIGMATSLVHSKEVSDEDVRFVFTANVVLAVIVVAALFSAARPLAEAFGKPELAPVFQGLSPVFLFNAMASVSTALLRRKLDYRTIQLVGLAAYVFGFAGVGLALAWWGAGVHALTAGFVAQSLITWVVLYACTRHGLRPLFSASSRRKHLGFGGAVLATNLVNWAATSADRLVIGRLFTAASVGLYSGAYNLVFAPANLLYPGLQSTVFSATARMRDDVPRQRRAWLDLLGAVFVLALPLFAALSACASAAIRLVYGEGWAAAGALGPALSLAAPFLLVWGVSTPLLWNTDQGSKEAKVQLPFIGVVVVSLAVAAQWSLAAVAWTTAALFACRSGVVVGLVRRAVHATWADVLKTVAPGTGLAVLCSGVAMAAMRLSGGSLLLGFSLAMGCGIAAWAATLLAFPRLLPAGVRRLANPVSQRLPSWCAPLLRRFGGAA